MQSDIPKIDFLATSTIIRVLWEHVIIKVVKKCNKTYTTDKGRNGVYYLPVGKMQKAGNRKITGPRRGKTCRRGVANNTGADQPAHPRSLISAFVIRFLESIISRLAPSKISNF